MERPEMPAVISSEAAAWIRRTARAHRSGSVGGDEPGWEDGFLCGWIMSAAYRRAIEACPEHSVLPLYLVNWDDEAAGSEGGE